MRKFSLKQVNFKLHSFRRISIVKGSENITKQSKTQGIGGGVKQGIIFTAVGGWPNFGVLETRMNSRCVKAVKRVSSRSKAENAKQLSRWSTHNNRRVGLKVFPLKTTVIVNLPKHQRQTDERFRGIQSISNMRNKNVKGISAAL